jgi:predicted outer membrane protein
MLLRRMSVLAITIGAIGSMCGTLSAQDIAQRHEADKPVIAGLQQVGANSADSQLAGCLIVDNQGEIVLGKLAQEKSQNNDVKQFAQQMVQDHNQFMQQLERFAVAGNQSENMGVGQPPAGAMQQQAAGNTDRSLTGAMTQPMGGQSLNFVQLKQQIGQKCLQMTERDLDQKEGSQFDKCYIGQQIGAHVEVLATLEVFRNQASPELAAVLGKGIETTKTHLEHAQQLAKSLEQH